MRWNFGGGRWVKTDRTKRFYKWSKPGMYGGVFVQCITAISLCSQ